MATTADIEAVRDHIGDTPDDPTVAAAFDRLGDAAAAALSILRRRRATMLANPASLSDNDGYQRDYGANIAALESQIADLEGLVGTGLPAVTTALLTRCTPGR